MLGGAEATVVAGALDATAAGVTAAVARLKLPELEEDVEDGRDAGSTPVVPELVVQRPWQGVPLEVEPVLPVGVPRP